MTTLVDMPDPLPPTRKFSLEWLNDLVLTVRIFPEGAVGWQFQYRYFHHLPDSDGSGGFANLRPRQRALICDWSLWAVYDAQGTLTDPIKVHMHIILPHKLGQKRLYGVDISPGAKTFVELVYGGTGDSRPLTEVSVGGQTLNLADAPPDALLKPIPFPFPIPDRLINELGDFNVPFLCNTDEAGNGRVPDYTGTAALPWRLDPA